PLSDLPPFPTRRSSDLVQRGRNDGVAADRAGCGRATAVGRRDGIAVLEAGNGTGEGWIDIAVEAAGIGGSNRQRRLVDGQRAVEDRKSIRLNSSHQIIS